MYNQILRVLCAIAFWPLIECLPSEKILDDDQGLQPGSNVNLHPIYKDGLWGYVDNNGRIAIRPQFRNANDFYEGRAAIETGEKAGYIRPDGSWAVVLPENSFPIGRFSEGCAWFAKDGRAGCVDVGGKIFIPPIYDRCDHFSEGLAAVAIPKDANLRPDPFNPELDPKLHGYVDRNGRIAVPLRFRSARSFHDGLALTDEGYIDRTGKVAISLRNFSSDPDLYVPASSDYSDGRALVPLFSKSGRPSKGVLIDTKGKRVATLTCNDLGTFSEGLATINVNNKIGYIDITGGIVIAARFDTGQDFHEGLCLVRAGDELQYIDKVGAVIARGGRNGPKAWNDAEDFHGGLARIHIGGTLMKKLHSPWWWRGGEWCYIDRTGKIICVCRIDEDKFIEPSFGLHP